MAISVSANTLINNNTILSSKTKMATNYVAKHAEQKTSAVSVNSENKSIARVMEGSDLDKPENDRLLRKMQLSKTRLDALGEYFDFMQTAKGESGSNGLLMFRRVSNLTGTQKEYKESDNHKNKKLTDTFVSDQVEVLRQMQEELLEEQARRAEENESEQDTVQDDDANTAQNTEQRNVSARQGETEQDKRSQSVSVAQAVQKQKAGANVYKNSFANQKRGQMAVNMNSMI